MINTIRRTLPATHWWNWLIVPGVLLVALFFGYRVSITWLMLLAVLIGAVLLLRWPRLGFLALIVAALLVPLQISTGTDVNLNATALLVPILMGIWLLNALRGQELKLAPARANRPLGLFLLLGLLSILISNATWDPAVPKADRFILVQLTQWAIFAFSFGIFWLVGMWGNLTWLRRMTVCFLVLGGLTALIRLLPDGDGILTSFATTVFNRAPFWMLLAAVAGGQLLFNHNLKLGWRLALLVIVSATVYFSLFIQQDRSSNWVGVGAALGTLVWFRFPRVRWLVLLAAVALLLSGKLFDSVYEFAGGDAKWNESGASRGELIGRVIELSMRNPITGIGPAAYRPYGFTKPLFYQGAYYIEPRLNSHNNYVDLFSQVGVIGLGLFLWAMAEIAWLGWRLRKKYQTGFAAGYVNGMLGAWAGIMIISALADWFLPFVYNIGFTGFQISVLIWMFLGGLVALDNLPASVESRSPSGSIDRHR
jgi:O-antigen ligase